MPRVHPFRLGIEKTKTSFVSPQTDPIDFVHLRYCLILAYLLGDLGQYRDPLQTAHQISPQNLSTMPRRRQVGPDNAACFGV